MMPSSKVLLDHGDISQQEDWISKFITTFAVSSVLVSGLCLIFILSMYNDSEIAIMGSVSYDVKTKLDKVFESSMM